MASNTATDCGICSDTFDEKERCPRILPCSHCLCSKCINQIIKTNAKSCPFCRQSFRARSCRDLSINRSLVELLKHVAKLETTIKSLRGGKHKPLVRILNDFREENKEKSKENLAECERAAALIQNAISSNSVLRHHLVCTNKKIDGEIMTKLEEIKKSNEKHIKYLEEKNRRLKTQLEGALSREKTIKDVNTKLKAASNYKDAASVMGKAEEINSDMKVFLRDLESYLTGDEKTRLTLEKISKKTNRKMAVFHDVLASSDVEEVEDINNTAGAAPAARREEVLEQITVNSLRTMNDPLRLMIRRQEIFAVQDLQEEGKRYARITITEDNQLCLHRLKEEEPLLANVQFIKFDDVMSLVDISCRRTFLELAIGGRNLGRVQIRMSDDLDNKYALNFIVLCTGERGPSYANTNILKVPNEVNEEENEEENGYVKMGDYESNNGAGGKAQVDGLDLKWVHYRCSYRKAWDKGVVNGIFGIDKASQFLIHIKDYHNSFLPSCFGMVEEGLDILTEAVSLYPNICDVRIVDCGILLSLQS